MHMLRRKDLNPAELDTIRVSTTPTTIIRVNGKVQTNEEATVYVYDLIYSVQILEDTPTVLSLGKLCEDHGYSFEWTSGHKPHLIKNCRIIQCNTENYMSIVVPGLSTRSSSSTASTSPTSIPQDLTVEDYTPNPASTRRRSTSSRALGDQLHDSEDTEDRNKEIDPVPGIRSDDLQEWLEDFTENLADERVSASRDAPASTSGESDSELLRKVVFAKHSIFSHLPKDGNCEVCKRTNITGPPCKRRIGNSLPRAENCGDSITAYHKVLSEECCYTSWLLNGHNHTRVKPNKSLQETEKSLRKFLEPSDKPKVIHTDTSLEFGKACEESSRNHCASTPHRSETNGIDERAVRRIKEGTSVVPLQSGLDEKWWADSMECYCYLRKVQDLLADGKKT